MKELHYDLETMESTATEVRKRLFTVDEYYRMVKAGILHEHDRIELIEGEILEMGPIGDRHWICVDRANSLFTEALGRRAIVSIQNPSRLNNRTEPQPDVGVYKPRADFYEGKRRGPDDVLLIIEVADSSLAYDRKVKAPLYAKAGIPEFWVEDLKNETLFVYRDLSGGSYATVLSLDRSDSISPIAFPDVTFKIQDLLGDPPSVAD